ncbi:peroxisomal testis-specific protein 1 [Ochotona curzoniae]|uniref:peroxisomal testis-specific protein 1 n=1 Tax=Ochotona curzoniae TaxID=130825 RepID=UPI001B3517C4|nr:peroxisomal testis-specific protein 1 [Ochotona curzoniae]
MERKKHHRIVYEPTAVLNPSPKVTNCCKWRWAKYRVEQAYMTRLVGSQLAPAMSADPDPSPPSQSKEGDLGLNHHQEEVIQRLAMQLRDIGDSINQRMIPEDPPLHGRAALARFVFFFFRRAWVLLRLARNEHLL